MSPEQRKIIVHCHLFKNAGTTFDWSLARNFGEDFMDHRDSESMRRGAEYLGPLLEEYDNLRAISSHAIRFPLPELPDTRLFPAIILRHPIDRVSSVYSFERKQKKMQTPGAINAGRMSFPEYVMWRMDHTQSAGTIRNAQTRACLDKQKNVIFEADFHAAKKRIRNTDLLCVIDYYDQCMVLFEEALRPHFPHIDLSFVRKNVTRQRASRLEHRINHVNTELGLEIADTLSINNHWDLRLYREAEKIVQHRMATLPDFDRLLDDFRSRCENLQPKEEVAS